jgi:hypothetical protein
LLQAFPPPWFLFSSINTCEKRYAINCTGTYTRSLVSHVHCWNNKIPTGFAPIITYKYSAGSLRMI